MLRHLKQLILTTLFALFAAQASAMFIQPDWIDPTQPGVGTNRYAYSGNDPVNQRDPNGNWYEGHYGVYPKVPYNTNPNANPLARALDNTGRYILNTPTSMLNLFADGLYGTGEALAPHAGTLENAAITTPTAIDDVAAGAVSGFTRLSTALGQRSAALRSSFADPAALNFSQRTARGNGRADALRQSMSQNGWNGPAVDVVRTPNGSLVAIDNTRVAVARELGITRVPVNIRTMDEALPDEMIGRFGNAETWGDALSHRTGRNRLGIDESNDSPRMPSNSGRSGCFDGSCTWNE